MNAKQNIIERLVFECGYRPQTIIGLAILLSIVLTYLLFRERRVLGNDWASIFWILRNIALAVFVWMFLQPTQMTETQTTLPKSVAVIIDNSNSMRVVDEESEGQGVSWRLATADSPQRDPQVAVDSALLAVEFAAADWQQAQREWQQGSGSATVEKRLTSAAFALERAEKHLENFAAKWEQRSGQRKSQDFAEQFGELAETARDLAKRTMESPNLEKNAQAIQRSRDAIETLVDSQRLAQTWIRGVRDAISRADIDTQNVHRQAQAVALVNRVQEKFHNRKNAGPADLQINRFTFEDSLTPVVSSGPWKIAEVDSVHESSANEDDSGSRASVTNLAAAMEQVSQLSATNALQGAIFLTDARHNAIDSLAPIDVAAKPADIPFSFVPIGSLTPRRDIQIYHVEHPRTVNRGDKILIRAFLSAAGYDGKTCNLQLRADGELIEEKQLHFDSDAVDLDHSFTVPTEAVGSIEFELSTDPLEEEASQSNNLAIFQVDVVRDKTRVLLADRIRRWEFGYLDHLLYRDEHFVCDQIQYSPRIRATGLLKAQGRLPNTVEEWDRYEVAIIGDVTPDQLPPESQSSLVEFVREKGGVAILIAGRDSMPHRFATGPLNDLLPVQTHSGLRENPEYRPVPNRMAQQVEAIQLDDSWAKSQAAWSRVFRQQSITWVSDYCRPRPTARRLLDLELKNTLANDADVGGKPSWICWQQVGAGRVVYLSAPDTYRLRYRQADRLHHRFWAQLFRWITNEDPGNNNGLVQLTTDKVRYLEHETVEVAAVLTETTGEPAFGADLSVVFDDGVGGLRQLVLAPDEDRPGRYAAQVDQLATGSYRIRLSGEKLDDLLNTADAAEKHTIQTFINVVETPDVELVNTVCDRPLMRQIAEASGGHLIPPTALGEWLELQTGVPETISQMDRQPLWNRWSYLCIALGCLFTEWIVRRTKDLT